MTAPLNNPRTPPYKLAGLVMTLLALLALVFVYLQFRGNVPWMPHEKLTLSAARSGLSMDPGAKVTFNGVEIGRVIDVSEYTVDVNPKYLKLIPRNVDATIDATTVFGNKYVNFRSPKDPSPQRITPADTIEVSSVTTEFNTLFETVVSISQQVDPIKLNQTLAATAEALDGLGDRFGQSIIHGNEILDDVNPKMPQIRRDNQLLADLGETSPTPHRICSTGCRTRSPPPRR
jgi:phospholipid/cholesterol/gamma-HCH transport system substrate-binding protein